MPGIAKETRIAEGRGAMNKRKLGNKKARTAKKIAKVFPGTGEKVKVDRRMKKLFRKRARDYNSDEDASASDDADQSAPSKIHKAAHYHERNSKAVDFDEEPDVSEDEDEDEDNEALPSITKFAEGCRAFRVAFKSIIKKNALDDVLGPILSGQKKLVAQKLAEEESEKKLKGEAKKEKHLVKEKGHVKPANILDAHEKFLLGVATKGVVKLFNAVNKAQSAEKGLNPSSSKDAKAIKKRRKEAFFTALGKPSALTTETSAKVRGSTDGMESEPPSWAPLRDNYMLASSKLKDWDKMQETTIEDEGVMSEDSSSSEGE